MEIKSSIGKKISFYASVLAVQVALLGFQGAATAARITPWTEADTQVLAAAMPHIPHTIIRKEAVAFDPGEASKINNMLFIYTDYDQSYVIKTVLGYPTQAELDLATDKTIDTFKDILEVYRSQNGNIKVPYLTSYFGAETVTIEDKAVYIFVMSKAPGRSLYGIQKDLYSTALGVEPSLTEQEAIEMGTEIGRQTGRLTRAFSLRNEVLVHGDPGLQNYMYDAVTKTFSWVDLSNTYACTYTKGRNIEDHFNHEEYVIKSLWRFFPQASFVLDLKEDIDVLGVEKTLKPYRIGISFSEAFLKGYEEETRSVDRTAWGSPENSYVEGIQRCVTFFKDEIKTAFGPKSSEVLSYLFESLVTPQVVEDLPQKVMSLEALPSLENAASPDNFSKIASDIFEKLNTDRMYHRKDPIYTSLRRFFWNDYSLTDNRNYIQNLALLEKPMVQNALKRTLKEIVGVYEGMKKETPEVTESILNQLFSMVYENLKNDQDIKLKAKKGRTHS